MKEIAEKYGQLKFTEDCFEKGVIDLPQALDKKPASLWHIPIIVHQTENPSSDLYLQKSWDVKFVIASHEHDVLKEPKQRSAGLGSLLTITKDSVEVKEQSACAVWKYKDT